MNLNELLVLPTDPTPSPSATPAPANVGVLDGATETALPGLSTFKGLVLGLIPYALVACVAAFLVGAILWAVGAFGHNPQHSSKGKTTLVVALAAALLVGASAYLVGWFNDRGKDVKAAPAAVERVVPHDSDRAF